MGRKSAAEKGKGKAKESPPPRATKRPRSSGIHIDPQGQPTRPRSPPPRRDAWDFLDLDARTKGRSLRSREFLETKTIDFNALEKFGVKEEVLGYINALSWNEFIKPRYPGYKNLTLEFLSTLTVHKKGDDELGYYGITFSLFGKSQVMPKAKLDECFGFSSTGISHFLQSKMDIREFWEEIGTTSRFRPSHTQAKHISSLGHFILHKIICNSVFAKKDGNDKISQKELLFLFCAIKGKEIQTGFFFIDHLLHLQASKSGAIMVGSFISKLASFLHFDLERPQAYPLSSPLVLLNGLMDLEFFVKKVGIVQQQGDDTYIYLGGLPEEELKRMQEEKRKAQEEAGPSRPIPAQPLDSSTAALLQELLASNRRIEARLDAFENTLASQSTEIHYIHCDLIGIREEFQLHKCEHKSDSDSNSDSEESDEV